MLYSEFIIKAENLTIEQADNGLFYLEPMWRSILNDNQLYFNAVSDFDVSPEEVLEVLQLEVAKRNAIISKKPDVENWLYEVISGTVDPAITDEENEYIKDFLEYMKAKKDKDNIIPFPTA